MIERKRKEHPCRRGALNNNEKSATKSCFVSSSILKKIWLKYGIYRTLLFSITFGLPRLAPKAYPRQVRASTKKISIKQNKLASRSRNKNHSTFFFWKKKKNRELIKMLVPTDGAMSYQKGLLLVGDVAPSTTTRAHKTCYAHQMLKGFLSG